MPTVNWEIFLQLPGGAEYNFEMLCRALMRRHYGRYGQLEALAAQPGVEFHIKLHTSCSLGDPKRWYGWQCRWYDLPGGRALGTTRRNKIEKAIRTTEKVLPGLTDWVLWTRRPLTEGDQKWYFNLKTNMQRHLWTAADVEEHLSGEAEILRSTYFGELVLTPDALSNLHKLSVAQIRGRWHPKVHQTINVERKLLRMLGDKVSWENIPKLVNLIKIDAAKVDSAKKRITGMRAQEIGAMVEFAHTVTDFTADVYKTLDRGDLELLRQQLVTLPVIRKSLLILPRQLRSRRLLAGLTVTNLLSSIHSAIEALDDVVKYLNIRLVTVLADAGCGKTQLSAQLTAPLNVRSAGILLHGRDLHAGYDLDHLARRVVIQGKPASSMEALIAAVNAAGQRDRRRLPIILDGLNEAEDPRDWKALLATLNEILEQYPYVLAVCTLRTVFEDEALPPEVKKLRIPGFGHDVVAAIRKYFAHFKINPADAELPIELLSHPLTLYLFCEVTNPKKERTVGIEAMPGSLTALFERYLRQAADRIAELAPRIRRFYAQDVINAFDKIGTALWEKSTRSLDLKELRRLLDDEGRMWNESMIRALEQDGVLLRVPAENESTSSFQVIYDALAGHLVADAILTRHGRIGFEQWFKEPATVTAFGGPLPGRHPLAADTFHAFVGLAPRKLLRQQLWTFLEEPLRSEALLDAVNLEAAYLDSVTVDALPAMITRPPAPGTRDLLDRLRITRGAAAHPLNAEFLDAVLKPMTVADRDLRWTEWLRRHSESNISDIKRLGDKWRDTAERGADDLLRARWAMWTLTSTVRPLRDWATYALYWFGRGNPSALFNLTLEALAINDVYVSERMLAASYGVTMAHQLPEQKFSKDLAVYLEGLRDNLTGTAAHPTYHYLARLYVQGTFEFAYMYYHDAIPKGIEINARVPFSPGPAFEPISKDDPRFEEVEWTLGMDFKNYTIGRLFRDRRSYDWNHLGHQAAVAHVRGIVWAMGWRAPLFDAIDNNIASYESRSNKGHTERYGKKYGWIGLYNYAGILDALTILPRADDRMSDVDIDPSYPIPPGPAPVDPPVWIHSMQKDDRRWMRQGKVEVPDDLLYRLKIDSNTGPWIAVYADLDTQNKLMRRRVFGFISAILVDTADADQLIRLMRAQGNPGGWLPDIPRDYHTFSGEIPWGTNFARRGADGNPAGLYRQTLDLSKPIEIEILAHQYGWERNYSEINEGSGSIVPSRNFSTSFNLRGVPQSFNQVQPDGTAAAISLGAPAGFNGNMLYLREDLIHRYAAGRRLIWFIWGERQIDQSPKWLSQVREKGEDVWYHIRRGEELSRMISAKKQKRSSNK